MLYPPALHLHFTKHCLHYYPTSPTSLLPQSPHCPHSAACRLLGPGWPPAPLDISTLAFNRHKTHNNTSPVSGALQLLGHTRHKHCSRSRTLHCHSNLITLCSAPTSASVGLQWTQLRGRGGQRNFAIYFTVFGVGPYIMSIMPSSNIVETFAKFRLHLY